MTTTADRARSLKRTLEEAGLTVLHDHCSRCQGRRVQATDEGLAWCVCLVPVEGEKR